MPVDMASSAPYMLGFRILQRLAMSSGVILISSLQLWTNQYLGTLQGLCIAILVFAITKQLDKDASIRPKLLKRVCLLYCNQQVRRLFITNDNSPASIFSDILLAIALAVIAIVLYDERTNPNSTKELKQMLESLLYLYGDILDFAFQYGVLSVTVCAFGVSMFVKTQKPPSTHIQKFCWRMVAIISANLLSQGMTELIPRSTPQVQFLQCLASVCILRLILPDMQSYLIYLAAYQLQIIAPGLPTLFFCALVCLEILPESSRDWVGELCFTYIIACVASYLTQIPFWGMLFVLIMAHYVDYILTVITTTP